MMLNRYKIYITGFILSFTMIACGSFNPYSNVEVAEFPPENVNGIDVKDHIKESLQIMYPNIGKYKLENELDGHKALFHLGGSYFKVSFNSKGNWKKSKVDIRFTQSINEMVREGIRKTEFKDWKIINKELEEKTDKKEFKFAFQKGKDVYELKFNGEGQLIKKEKTTIQIVQ
jgi:hypothetical protein